MKQKPIQIIILFLLLICGTIRADEDYQYVNQVEMITLEDIELAFGVKAKGKVILKNDGVLYPSTGFYHREYKYIDVSGLMIGNELILCGSTLEAKSTIDSYIRGVEGSMKESGSKFIKLDVKDESISMYHVLNDTSQVTGMLFFKLNENTIYKLWLSGVYFESYKQLQTVFGKKINKIVSANHAGENV